jgi:membrane-bound lytic murein transglycosylase D
MSSSVRPRRRARSLASTFARPVAIALALVAPGTFALAQAAPGAASGAGATSAAPRPNPAPSVIVSVRPAATARPPSAPTARPAPPATAKPATTAAPKPTSASTAATPSPTGKPLVTPNPATQRAVAGGPTTTDLAAGPESEELRALREAELDLFAGAAPGPRSSWPSELPTPPKGPLAIGANAGLPPAPPAPPTTTGVPASGGKSLAWLSGLKLPDLPVRWDARVVKYLEFFKDDPRGRRLYTVWYKRSGRYRDLIQAQLRAKGMPEDLAWIAMAESGFDPVIKSPAGAGGLWQFMPETGRSYGLSSDRWADGRYSPIRSTDAAIAFLGDLKRRFGSWELAIASYNMGYGGVLSVVKRFNTNDYWELSRLENALPWETTLYVPKIIAMAIVARNPQTFGYDDLVLDASLKGDRVEVPAGTELRAIALAAGCTTQEIEKLNPELRAGRTPPSAGGAGGASTDDATYVVMVPAGKGQTVKDASAKLAPPTGKGGSLEKYVVRFGETLDLIAAARKTTKAKLVELNAIRSDEAVRGGTVLLVPALPAGTAPAPSSPFAPSSPSDPRPIVVVPPTSFAYADRRRVFYKVLVGDTPRDIADAFGVSLDQLRTWNSIEPSARLQEGMTLQIFVAKDHDLSRVVALEEKQAKIVAVGSDEFYALEEEKKGRRRTTVLAKKGETIESIGKRYGLSAASMEKINRRPRSDVLMAGEAVIVYVPASGPPVPSEEPKAKPGEMELPALPPPTAGRGADAKGAART